MATHPSINTSWLLRKLEEKEPIVGTSLEEELALGVIIQDPNSSEEAKLKAIHTLVVRNLYLVFKLSHKYKRNEFEFEDIVSYGIMGLFNAATRYNPERGYKFATYAYHWIKESIMKAVREYSGVPKIPAYLVKNLWKIARLISSANHEYTDDELATHSGIDVDTTRHFRSLLFKTVTFDQNYAPVDYSTPEEVFRLEERRSLIHDTLRALLSPQEFLIVAHTTGLDGAEILKTKEIGIKYHIKNIKRVKRNAYRKMAECPLLKQLYGELKG